MPTADCLVTIGHTRPMRVREPDAVIAVVEPGSIADQLGLLPGDRVLRINGQPPRDVIDYQLWTACEELDLLCERAGEELSFAFDKDEHEDLGLGFETDLFTPLRTCNNGCLFCFVTQAPAGLRPTVYVKDDDYRLSFLHGHFTTLTNLTEPHFERILDQGLSPLHVSVHASEPALRRVLLDNAKADAGWEYLERLVANGIECHSQVVVCPGVNDALHLDRTIEDLLALGDSLLSIGVVPVGLTRYQQHPAMRPMTVAEAAATIAQVDRWRGEAERIYAADELFLMAGVDQPDADYYHDFCQLENGVGETRLLLDELAELLPELPDALDEPRRVTVVTGGYGQRIFAELEAALQAVDGLTFAVVGVENVLFGGNVECAGLLAGRDIAKQLGRRHPDELVLLPARALNERDVTLDDWSLDKLAEALGCEVEAAGSAAEILAACGIEVELEVDDEWVVELDAD